MQIQEKKVVVVLSKKKKKSRQPGRGEWGEEWREIKGNLSSVF